jgi:photoactive yellow protein
MQMTATQAGLPAFDTPRLAEAVEALTPEQVEALPFGAVRLDPEGRVALYNATERRLSGLRREAIGRVFFAEIAPCMDNPDFRGRIERARAAGRLDVAFGYVSDMPSGDRDVALDVRVQSASDGGTWMFLQREA